MSFKRWGYEFDGSYTSPYDLQASSGVYVIWCKSKKNWNVLDVEEAADVKERVSNHDRADCWSQNCLGKIYYFVTYTPYLKQICRMLIEQKIQHLTNSPCGER